MIVFDKYDKFGDYHWQQWKDQNHTYSRHARWCSQWVKERTCFDVGCGDGLITHLLGPQAFGVDVLPLAVELARKHGVCAHVGSAYALPKVKVPCVFMGDILEHLEYPKLALSQVRGVLKGPAFLYISTPPRNGALRPYHVQEWTADELVAMLRDSGFDLDSAVMVNTYVDQMYAKFRMRL